MCAFLFFFLIVQLSIILLLQCTALSCRSPSYQASTTRIAYIPPKRLSTVTCLDQKMSERKKEHKVERIRCQHSLDIQNYIFSIYSSKKEGKQGEVGGEDWVSRVSSLSSPSACCTVNTQIYLDDCKLPAGLPQKQPYEDGTLGCSPGS